MDLSSQETHSIEQNLSLFVEEIQSSTQSSTHPTAI